MRTVVVVPRMNRLRAELSSRRPRLRIYRDALERIRSLTRRVELWSRIILLVRRKERRECRWMKT